MKVMRYLILLILTIVGITYGNNCYAYDTEIDGLLYDWVSYNSSDGPWGKVTLVGYSSSKITEDLNIPCFVTWNSKKKGTYNRSCQVGTVGANAFKNCEIIKKVDFCGVNGIMSNSFEGCILLESITISNSINLIGPKAFSNCTALSEIIINDSQPPTLYDDAFDENTYLTATLIVPQGSVNVYKNTESWCKFKNITDGTNEIKYTLDIIASGSGYASYSGTTIRNKTGSFIVNEGTSATITFTPDTGYRIKSVKVNSADVTSSVSNNSYTISSITANTTLEVEFEAIPPTTYTLSIKATGNGSATYDGTTIRSKTSSFTVNEGTSATIFFTPDNGYRIKSVKVNSTNVTSSVSNNQYTISSISANTTLEVEFVESSPIITFADASVKAICVANWDTDGDAELSENEAAAVTYLGGAFYENKTITSFEELHFFVGIEDLSSAFRNCSNLKKVVIPNSVKNIGKWAFQNCSALTGTLEIPTSVTTIGESAFEGCSGFTGSLTIPNSVTAIGERTFLGCSGFSGSLTISNSLKTISSFAFYGCSGFTGTLKIPNSVSFINRWAFQDCSGLTGLIIPNSVTSIGDYAFWNCSNLSDVISQISSPYNIGDVFRGISVDAILHVPYGTKTKYQELSGWNQFFKEIIEDGTYTLSIISTGNGTASYNNTIIREKTSSFTVKEGTSATISFTPDNGYRIKSVKVNNIDVTSNISNNSYTISSITANTTLEVEFEAIPPTTYTLSIKATGNGSASYDGTTIRSKTSSFTVNEATSATISFTPDDGYRIKSVKVNSTDVTSSVSNNSYTISSITANTTLEVEFEAIPPTTYTLSIKATGNGSASYGGTTIRSKTSSFTVNEGTSATISFTPDDGYRIKSVKVNSTDVTSNVSNNSYTISSITANTTLEVEFEAIPPTTYTLSIKATGNGSATYNSTTIKNKTQSFTVNEGTSATISFTPDTGYRIKNVKVNSADVTSSVSNNSYTISSITANTALEVEFEVIPVTTYTLSIKATGNGSATYNSTTIKNKTQSFTVNEGTSATISFTPDTGYRIKNVKVNSADVTSSVSNNSYTISSITANTALEVEFEAIPIPTYTLSIKATGNGSASYNGTTVRNKTSSFSVNEGTSATISFTPDDGYRIKSVKVNSTDVTSNVSNNSYTINSITANTTVEVDFEETLQNTVTLISHENGYTTCNGHTITNDTYQFKTGESEKIKITAYPNEGYRVARIKYKQEGLSDTSIEWYDKESISRTEEFVITRNTTFDIEFEAIPITTYTLSIKATGNGTATYSGTTIRSKTSSFTINEGTSATISFTPDDGYRIKSVKENDTNVTSYVSNNIYTINSISRNTTIEVEFEAIPPTTYTLSIKATGNGSASYGGTTIRSKTSSFTINEGTSATISFSPDAGYRIKSVKVNSTDVTSSVSNNSYTINSISANTTLEVEFEVIPVTTYTLSIKATGNGSATYNSTTIKNKTQSFTVNEGTSATVSFSPDNGNSLNNVKVNGTDVTSQVTSNRYTISNIKANATLEVTFIEDITAITAEGVNYKVVSQSDGTINLATGDYGQVLTVPVSVTSNNKTWQVVGIEQNALKGNNELAAIIWNPAIAFNTEISNPNLLLYVKDGQYAPPTIQNVVVNSVADKIVLIEAASGNKFYCPQSFTAHQISYTHNYKMQTGVDESRGWETIALPFDVQSISHEGKGNIKAFANWKHGDAEKPFWLYELTGSGFVEASNIKANTPYIISMPNHPRYDNEWLLKGKVTFAASNVSVSKTEDIVKPTYGDRTFVPCFSVLENNAGIYALNVNNDYETNTSGMTEGSKFVLNMRRVHPFEAYMTTSSNAPQYSIGIFDGMTTGIRTIEEAGGLKEEFYDLQGRKTNAPTQKGVYIKNRKKVIIK